MPFTLKLKCQGEVRRVQLQDGDHVTYEYVCEKIRAAFPELGPHTAKYPDDEGDLCTLCSSTFHDFLSLADNTAGHNLLKIEIFPAAAPDVTMAAAVGNQAQEDQPPAYGSGAAPPQPVANQAQEDQPPAYDSGAAPLQPGEAQQVPLPAADDTTNAFTAGLQQAAQELQKPEVQQGLQVAAQAMQMPEVQQAIQGLQGVKGFEGLPALLQLFTQPGAGAAPNATGSAPAGPSAVPGNGMQGFEGLQNLVQAFAQGAGAHGQPMWTPGSSNGSSGCQWADSESWLLKPKKCLWVLAQLRATGCLSAKVVAGMTAHMMSKLVPKVVENVENIDCEIKLKLNDLRPSLEDLRALVSCTPGLEHCEGVIGAVLSDESSSAGEAALLLVTALDVLPFEAQVAFVEAFYASQEKRLHEVLDATDEQTPGWSKVTLEHVGITCDGCGVSPMKGLRYKCTNRADFDLCGNCFSKKDTVLGGQCANDEFGLIVTDLKHEFHGIAKKCKDWWAGHFEGKGKGKGKWAFKGKGKGKGWWGQQGGSTCSTMGSEARPCANGCGFQATWHPTHCCGGCSRGAPHGPRCQRIPMPAACTQAEPDTAVSDDAPQPKRARLSFPVVIEDGRELTIEWDEGESPHDVAKRFADSNGILPDEFQTIVDFVAHASALAHAQSAQAMQEETVPANKDADQEMETLPANKDAEQEAVPTNKDADQPNSLDEEAKKLEEMGFGCAEELRVLLEACGGNVQLAIESLTN